MIVCIKNKKKDHLELTGEFRKVTGYKTSVQNQVYLYMLAMNTWTLIIENAIPLKI
jgi:hypothetical protein